MLILSQANTSFQAHLYYRLNQSVAATIYGKCKYLFHLKPEENLPASFQPVDERIKN